MAVSNLSSDTVIDIARKGRTNPDSLQRMQIQLSESMVDGPVSLNNAGTPFINLYEMNAVMTAMQMRENIAQLSNIYPSLTTTEDELAHHMTFKDFIGRWAFPSKTEFTIGLPLQEVMDNAIDVGDGSGTRKLTIPGMSRISVSGSNFTLQYPIDIFIMKHDSISVQYDLSRISPLYTPSTSRLEGTWTNKINNVDMLYIPFEIYQFSIVSQSTTISGVAGFRQEYSFDNKFFMVRCYRSVGTQGSTATAWEEINVTFSDVTYDPTRPTVVAQVDPHNQRVTVEVPQIYLSSGMLANQIRIDIYTTQGALDLTLESFKSQSFAANWVNPDVTSDIDPKGFGGRMGKFTSIYFNADKPLSGGHDGLTFNEIRERVILRSTRTEGPPTSDLQISNLFKDSGFSKTTVIDDVTDREFLATKLLPKPEISKEAVTTNDTLQFAVSSLGAVVQAQSINLNELSLVDTVVDNGERLTVLPSTLYSLDNGKLNIVPDVYVKQLKNTSLTPVDQLVNTVNGANYYYTPFFYVHDISANEYEIRPYSLDKPEVVRKYAIASNNTLGISAAISEYSLTLMPDYSGWRYIFAIAATEGLKDLAPDQVKFQMSYYDEVSNFRTIFNGTLLSAIDITTGKPVDNRYVFEVIVPTNWDVNKDDQIRVGLGSSRAPLLSSWDMVVFLKDYFPIGAVRTTIESAYNPGLLPDYNPDSTYVGLVQEQLSVKIGYHVNWLWKRANSTIEEWMYERYTEDIPAYYTMTIYETTPAGDPVFVMNPEGTALTQVVIHKEGDPILDELGKPKYAHYKGELKLDPVTKQPILVEGERGIMRNFDLVLLDGKYYFATADSTLDYRNKMEQTLVNWNNGIIDELNNVAINETRIYFHPKTTTGLMKVYVGDGSLVTIQADQHLSVDVIVPNHVYRNTILRRNLKITIIQAIDNYLANNITLSQSELLNAVRDLIEDDQIGIEIKGLFDNKYEAITVAYGSIGPAIGKRLMTDTALDITIEDSIDIDFSRHRASTLR